MIEIRTDLIRLFVAMVASLGIGLAINQFRAKPLPVVYLTKAERLGQEVDATTKAASTTAVASPIGSVAQPASAPVNAEPSIVHLTLAEFEQRLKEGGHVILDARPEIFHRLGHIANALSLPREEFSAYYERHRGVLERFKERPVLIYCQGQSCEDSSLVAEALVKLGFKKLYIFGGGWTEWTQQHPSGQGA